MSADVELHDISINFGDFYAAKDVSVMIKPKVKMDVNSRDGGYRVVLGFW